MKGKIYSWLLSHHDEMIEDICALVRIPSIQGEATAEYPFGEDCFIAVEKSMEIADRLGFGTSIFRNMVGQASMKPGKVDFGIWAHSDVVPVGGQWTDPPFEPLLREGKIYGRGTTDNKGQLVMALYALRCLKELGIELKHNVAVFAGSNEETGMADIKAWLAENEEPFFNLAPDADFAVGYAEKGVLRFFMEAPLSQKGLMSIGGGSALNIFPTEAKAVLRFSQINGDALKKLEDVDIDLDGDVVTVTARGKGGHSARALGADNPYAKLIDALDNAGIFKDGAAPQLRFIADVCRDDTGEILGIKCCDDVVGNLHFAGTVLNLDKGVISLGCDIRHPMSETGEELLAKIKKTCGNAGLDIRPDEINPSKYSDPNEPGAAACAAVYNSLAPEFGREEKQNFTLSGGTYARHFTRGYAFGLSAGGNAHNADEFVHVDRLIFGALVYALSLIELDKVYE